MRDEKKQRTLRWILSLILIAAGLSVAWAWGRVADLAEPVPVRIAAGPALLYAAWQPAEGTRPVLYRSADAGATWQPVRLPGEIAAPVAWASEGQALAVALSDGRVVRSRDAGARWTAAANGLPVLSLAWGADQLLYLGTDGQGLYRQPAGGKVEPVAGEPAELASQPVRFLALAGDRLLAATPSAIFYTDDGGKTWAAAQPVPGRISALAVADDLTWFAGTESAGVWKSSDGGRSWQADSQGLELAGGTSLAVTALRIDPQEPGVVYAAVGYLLGSTELHFAPLGTFVTLDGGAAWQKLSGPAFPEAQRASDLVVPAGKPLYVQAVTVHGLQAYAPDIESALAALGGGDAEARAAAARLLGLAHSQAAGGALVAALADADPAVSVAAADALGRIADPTLVPSLVAALDLGSAQVQRGAASALGMMRVGAATEPLGAILMQGLPETAGAAATALERIGSPAAIDALLAALKDAELTTRRHAALGALESLGQPAVTPLLEMLGGSDATARRNAAEALGWIRSDSATQALIGALGDAAEAVRQQAAWALGEIRDPSARAVLARVEATDPGASVRAAAALSLAQLDSRPVARTSALAAWAGALSRFEAARWLLLALVLLGAGWLALGALRSAGAPARQRVRRR